MPRSARVLSCLTCLTALVALSTAASAEPQSAIQQRCIQEIDKRAAGVAKVVAKEGVRCHKAISTSKLVGPTWSQCVDDLGAEKVAKAGAKTMKGREKKCDDAELPTLAFAAADPASVDAVNQAAQDQSRGLGDDVLRYPAVVVQQDSDKVAAKCQAELLKGAYKLLDVAVGEADGAIVDALGVGAGSEGELAAAIGAAWDASPKLQKTGDKLLARAEKKCAGVNPVFIFQGECSAGTIAEVAACAARRARCRACLLAQSVGGMALGCDTLDDGANDLSCP